MTLRSTAALVLGLAISSAPAIAGSTPGTTTPTSTVPSGTVVETGAVKTFIAEKHLITITVNQKDKVFNLGTVVIDPTITKVGTMVDITLNGATVISCVAHQQ